MGRPRTTTSTSKLSTSTAQPTNIAGPSAPSLAQNHNNKSRFGKKLLLRVTGLLAILSLIGISSAADSGDNHVQPTNNDSQKTSSINLDSSPGQATSNSGTNANDGNTPPANTGNPAKSGNSTNNSNNSYSVTVNDQPISVPDNGTSQQTIVSPDGGSTTNVTVTNSSSSQGSNFSTHSTTTTSNVQSNGVNQTTISNSNRRSP